MGPGNGKLRDDAFLAPIRGEELEDEFDGTFQSLSFVIS
jgi:hypothetical protein